MAFGSDRYLPLLAFGSGLGVTLLGFALFFNLVRSRRAALDQRLLLDSVLDNLDAYVYLKDSGRRFRYVNAKVAGLIGRPAAEIVGRRDIDVVTFAYPPPGLSQEQTRNLLRQRPDLFDQARCKQDFRCDVNIVNLSTAPEWLVTQTRYWYGLFSHRRADALWKGMLQLPLDSDDELARTALATLQGDTDARSA